MAPETLSRKQLRKAKQSGQSKINRPTDHHATAFEGPSQPLDVSADPVRESSSGGQARSSTVPSSSLANTPAHPATLHLPMRSQPSRAGTPFEDVAEAPRKHAVPGSAEGPYKAEAGDPTADPSEASANESPKDLGKDYRRAQAPASNKRVDWGGWAYESGLTALMERPGGARGFGTWGDEAKLKLNSHYVNLVRPKEKQEKFHQYNVRVGNGNEKRGLVKTVLESQGLGKLLPGGRVNWLFDGNEQAWSKHDIQTERRLEVDLSREPERAVGGRPDKVFVVIKPASTRVHVNLGSIYDYMNSRCSWGADVIKAINLLDHVLRQRPSEQFTTIKRSYFNRGVNGHDLHKGVEAVHGIYQSIRLAKGPKKLEGKGGLRMVTNVDVSYAPFWHMWNFNKIVAELTASGENVDSVVWREKSNHKPNGNFDLMRRLKDSGFTVEYKNMSDEAKRRKWKVAAILNKSAREYKFSPWDDTNKRLGQEITILNYYLTKYQVHLDHPDLPVVQTTKMITKQNEDGKVLFESPIVFPMELCKMQPNQRYLKALDREQTKIMVDHAIQPPQERLKRIKDSLIMLSWHEDQYLSHYGLKISPDEIETDARILLPPTLQFKNGSKLTPEANGKKGTWNLTDRQFISTKALRAPWGVMVLTDSSESKRNQTNKFVDLLKKEYVKLGGEIDSELDISEKRLTENLADLAKDVREFYDQIHDQRRRRPQILLFILPKNSSDVYLRIKNTCDCQLGVYSQCVQAKNAFRTFKEPLEPRQYGFFCNLLMKFNAKLGGATNGIVLSRPEDHFLGRTMIIGADVSHPAPGSQAPSYAAMTVSMDSTATRYAAAVQTNGYRKEMISNRNITNCLTPLIKRWKERNKYLGQEHLPEHVYYFRDGVSEDQFKILLDTEVASLKTLFSLKSMGKTWTGAPVKFTVVVAEKRHHIRFFPQGPKHHEQGNPLPGTIVDHDVTDPKGNDIYLCSHRAIKGTARPTHYIMLLDERDIPVNKFQKMLYEQCYQYIRSSTAVSLHPAVYYAHLASKRAQAHDSIFAADWPEGKGKGKGKDPATSSSDDSSEEPAPLLPLKDWKDGQTEWIGYGMWFI
ncbi:Protein argonaute [Xanthoria calcicola]